MESPCTCYDLALVLVVFDSVELGAWSVGRGFPKEMIGGRFYIRIQETLFHSKTHDDDGYEEETEGTETGSKSIRVQLAS